LSEQESTIFRGIGDGLHPYYILNNLYIDWEILWDDDFRIEMMEDCANAPPVVRPDLRFSRPWMLSALVSLHIDLRDAGERTKPDKCQREAMQLDLILRQFDLPALRHFHLSHESYFRVEYLAHLWSGILSALRLYRWPCLETVLICCVARYKYSKSVQEGRDKSFWVSNESLSLFYLSPLTSSLSVRFLLFKRFSIKWRRLKLQSEPTSTFCGRFPSTDQRL
jgi:hypothetical protein